MIGISDRSCKGGSLCQTQIPRLFAKVSFRSCGDSMITVSEVDSVHVELENFIFAADFRFDSSGQKSLYDFPADRPFFQFKSISTQLLSNG